MWVADMDFKTAPCIIEALKKRVEHGVFGYNFVPDSYYDAVINWFDRRHQWKIQREDILYTSGVVPAISCSLKAMTMPGDKVLIQTPVYNCFFSSIKNNGCEVLEKLTMPGYTYQPFAAVSDACRDNSVVLNSPSKAFNIAGLQIANIVCHQPERRQRINRALNINEVCDVNAFGIIALQEAYNNGGEWLDELKQYLYENYVALKEFFAEYLPKLEVCRLEGTYLAWVDLSRIELTADEAAHDLLEHAKVLVNSGTMYGQNDGFCYLRINLACPRATLMEGLKRIERELSPYMVDEAQGCPM